MICFYVLRHRFCRSRQRVSSCPRASSSSKTPFGIYFPHLFPILLSVLLFKPAATVALSPFASALFLALRTYPFASGRLQNAVTACLYGTVALGRALPLFCQASFGSSLHTLAYMIFKKAYAEAGKYPFRFTCTQANAYTACCAHVCFHKGCDDSDGKFRKGQVAYRGRSSAAVSCTMLSCRTSSAASVYVTWHSAAYCWKNLAELDSGTQCTGTNTIYPVVL